MITPLPWASCQSAVVIPDPEMSLSQCGLPVVMALSLWRPLLLHRLLSSRRATSLDDAQDYLEHDPEALDLLQALMQERPVLLRRDQPLRGLPLLWMIPRLVQDEAIHLHPLLMQRWSLHAEGEQLSARVLLSVESSEEARRLFGPSESFVSRLSWRPSLSLSEQACVGLFSLTHQITPTPKRRYLSMQEALRLYQRGDLSYTEEISLRYQGARFVTTAGRVLLAEVVPASFPFEELNRAQTSRALSLLVQRCFELVGASQTEAILLSLESLGVEHMTRSGFSLCIDDFVQAPDKEALLREVRGHIDSVHEQLDEGLILVEEKTNKVIDLWSNTLERLRSSAISSLRSSQNSLWLYMGSGGWQLHRRLLSAVGFTDKGPASAEGSHQIHEQPVMESQREGLSGVSFFYAAKSSRASMLSAMALQEEDAATLETLSIALRDVLLTQDDCGTSEGVELSGPAWPTARSNFATQMSGRVLAQGVASFQAGHRLSRADAEALQASQVNSIKVRSALTCIASDGVCAACYGAPFSDWRGVGVLAAQAFALDYRRWDRDHYEPREAVASQGGIVRFRNARVVINKDKECLLVSRRTTWALYKEEQRITEEKRLPYGAALLVDDGALVSERQTIARWSPHHLPLLAERPGIVRFQDLSFGVNYNEYLSPISGLLSCAVVPRDLDVVPTPSLQIQEGGSSITYPLRWHSSLRVEDGAEILAGDVLAERYKYAKNRQRPLLRELLEVTPPKEGAVLAGIDGVVLLVQEQPQETLVLITSEDGQTQEQIVSTKRLEVEDGDDVLRGDCLAGGDDDPHRILQILGERAAKQHLLRELQERLEADGAGLPVQHIEVLLREMFGYVKILDAGDSDFAVGSLVRKQRFSQALLLQRPPTAAPVLLGVTSLALWKTN
jgi:DNA-directed RNA polymerase subunit beta'